MTNVFGVSGAGYIWHNAMEEFLKAKPVTQFDRPPGLVKATVYAPVSNSVYTSTLGLENEPLSSRYMRLNDWFIEGTVPRLPYVEPTPIPVLTHSATEFPDLASPTPTVTATPTITATLTATATKRSPFLPLYSSISAIPTATATLTPTPNRTATSLPNCLTLLLAHPSG
jgi:hypothetical protein